MTEETVARLGRCVVEALRARGYPGDSPLTVGELYQELVPYGAVRSRLGVELNADYEDAMLRLLAGTGGLLHVESDQAREELQREAEAAVHSVDLFRKFSAYKVRARMPAVMEDPSGPAAPGADPDIPAGAGSTGEPGPVEESGQPEESGPAEDPGHVSPVASVDSPTVASIRIHRDQETGEEDGGASGQCFFCGEELPPRRAVYFCPSCGGDQRQRACSRCDQDLEEGWRYCVACGQSTGEP